MPRKLVGIAAAILLATVLLSLYISNYRLKLSRYSVSSPDIPASFDGFRIAQISDLHGRSLNKKILKAIKEAEPHIIVATGDLLDDEAQWSSVAELLREMVKRAPVYYVTGNHEWAHFDTEELLDRIEACGVTVLRNEYAVLKVGVDRIILAGIDDPNGYADMKTPSELAAEIRDAEGAAFSILLSHRPDGFEEYAGLGFDLILSGHVHGGLVRLPVIGGLFSPGMELLPKYSGGIYCFTYKDTEGCDRTGRLVVSRGLSGAVGIPRLFNSLDVPLVTLRKK